VWPVTIVLVGVVNKDDLAEAIPAEGVQCVVCLASVDDEVHGVLGGVEHLDTHAK